MVIGKSFVCYSKIDRDPVSLLLEIKGRPDTLLFESGAIAELCKYESCFILLFLLIVGCDLILSVFCFQVTGPATNISVLRDCSGNPCAPSQN